MKLQEIPWVIVQAGGQGNRLKHYTWNKPKCLLSVAGQPLIYHCFDRFPSANFLVIGDYLYDVLDKYLRVFPPQASVKLILAETKGTLSGIDRALTYITDNDPFLLVWCDLLFEKIPNIQIDGQNWIGLSRSFKCRWSYDNSGICVEKASTERGIAGFFVFQNKAILKDIPSSGEYVRWLSQQPIQFNEIFLDNTYELGTVDNLTEYQATKLVSRFFNSVEISENKVIKKARVQEFEKLIDRECNWYRVVHSLGFDRTPTLLSEHPMTISRIIGSHPFELKVDFQQKKEILTDIFQTLTRLHHCVQKVADPKVIREVYLQKTYSRVNSVAQLIPFFDQPTIQVNGLFCRNPFHTQYENWLSQLVDEIQVDEFTLIHGDPTFSNMLIDHYNQAWLIDPRGYFGSSLLYGDPMYDWAKLYYSVVGDYDCFNRRQFQLKIIGKQVYLDIKSNDWKDLEPMFAEKLPTQMPVIRLLHSLIWLSLSGYVKDDYDSILASFYNGLYWLETVVR
ncbi:NTP transferase domain-containing protein [Limnoraphis robusta]|uniref:NTP transferase domain-containing protein n=1 Tax=Limnoraphis robusta TaxID=1118279 RepID=UPI0009E6592E|nr:NTP transferase domain-containing protein [Limnoraphis robusta]